MGRKSWHYSEKVKGDLVTVLYITVQYYLLLLLPYKGMRLGGRVEEKCGLRGGGGREKNIGGV